MQLEQIIEILKSHDISLDFDMVKYIPHGEYEKIASEIRQLHEEELKKALRAAWNAGMDYDRNISNKNFNDFINEYLKSKP